MATALASAGQPRSAATAASRASASTTTGSSTADSSGRSLIESLWKLVWKAASASPRPASQACSRVTLPSRITGELLRALRPYHPLWVMTHFNHPKELTPASERACRRLADHGFPVMNQTVLLRGINDDTETLTALFRGLVRARVRPYYLLQMDPVKGASHLRTPFSKGVALMEQLQGKLSGIALPKLILDTPGGMGKVPIGPDYLVEQGEGRVVVRTHRGVKVEYRDPPR